MQIDQGQAGAEIEVTPAMVDAGVFELRQKQFGQALDEIAKDVFYVMLAAAESEANPLLRQSTSECRCLPA
jgi:hypothetical protein